MIGITKVVLGDLEKELVLAAIEKGMLAQGAMVSEFESQFGDVSGSEFVAAASNGTTALSLALRSLGVGPGDEVVTSSFTFGATVNAILDTGATARLVDIEEGTYLIDVTQVEAVLNDRTKVIMPVHLYGQPADMDALAGIATAGGVRIVEDAAQAHGARFGGKLVGSFDVAAFSFYATKNITTGEGGAVTTNDEAVDSQVRILRNQGMRNRYEYVEMGYNYRMTDLQAAIGIGQLARFEDLTSRRRHNAEVLLAGLNDIELLDLPQVADKRDHVWHQFTVAVKEDSPISRDALVDKLASKGVGAAVYYPKSLVEYDIYRSNPRVIFDDVSRSIDVANRVLSLPVHPYLTDGELDEILQACHDTLS